MFAARALKSLRPLTQLTRSTFKNTAIRFHHGCCGGGCGGHDHGIFVVELFIFRCMSEMYKQIHKQCGGDCDDCGGGCGGGGCGGGCGCGCGHHPALLKVFMIPNGEYQENAYLMWDDSLRQGLNIFFKLYTGALIDPGAEPKKIVDALLKCQVNISILCKYVFGFLIIRR